MTPAMTPSEISLLSGFLRSANNYVEFGIGGSTVLASSLVKRSIVSVESSAEWIEKVASSVDIDRSRIHLNLVHADIGPVGALGGPASEASRSLWPNYSKVIWSLADVEAADLYLVDGRFRVACFAAGCTAL
jgi:hypothetical protein